MSDYNNFFWFLKHTSLIRNCSLRLEVKLASTLAWFVGKGIGNIANLRERERGKGERQWRERKRKGDTEEEERDRAREKEKRERQRKRGIRESKE